MRQVGDDQVEAAARHRQPHVAAVELVQLVVRGEHGFQTRLVQQLAESLSGLEVAEVADDGLLGVAAAGGLLSGLLVR